MKIRNLLFALAVFATAMPFSGAQAQKVAVHKSFVFEPLELNSENRECMSMSLAISRAGNRGLAAIAAGDFRVYKKHRSQITQRIQQYRSYCGGKVTVLWQRINLGEETRRKAVRILDGYKIKHADEESWSEECHKYSADLEVYFSAHQAAVERFEKDPNADDLADLEDALAGFSNAFPAYMYCECGTLDPSIRVQHYDVR